MNPDADSKADHVCGRVVDYCVWEDTKFFFCIYCKKIITATKEEFKITIKLNDSSKDMKEYDHATLEELK